MQNIIKIIIFLIFFFIISVFYISLTRETNYDTSNLINKKISEFKVIYADQSGFYTRDDLKKNDFTLINFWASWCAPCKVEHPILMRLSKSKKLKILGTGEVKDKINIEADLASKSAIEKLEKIGGSIQLKK